MFAPRPDRPRAPDAQPLSDQPQEIVMCRKSSFLAIALSVTTLVYASVPAAAFHKTPQVSKAYNPHRRTAVGSAMYPMDRLGSPQISRPRATKGPAARTAMGSAEMPVRLPGKGKK
jgi:hypothetical protein